jgi:hypothetical protein
MEENTAKELQVPVINAVVAIDLATDMSFLHLRSEAVAMLHFAEMRLIQSDEDMKSATNDLAIIGLAKKAIDEKRQEYVRPLNEYVKTVNLAFKGLSDPVDQADRLTRDKVLKYRADQERKRLMAEAINRQKEELARKEAELSGTGEITVDTTPVIVPAAQSNQIRADVGTAGVAHTRKARVVNFALLDDAYKLPNDKLLATAAKTGVAEIKGVEFYLEESLRVVVRRE